MMLSTELVLTNGEIVTLPTQGFSEWETSWEAARWYQKVVDDDRNSAVQIGRVVILTRGVAAVIFTEVKNGE